MLKIRYISAIFLAFMITGLFLFYLLNFRYNSSLYSMMILDRCYQNKDNTTLNKYCCLEVFADSVLSHILPSDEIQDTAWKEILESLQQNKKDKDNATFFYNMYRFFKETFGEVIFVEEENRTSLNQVNVYYRPFPSLNKIKLELVFTKKKDVFQLQYIKNLKDVFVETFSSKKEHKIFVRKN